MACPPENEKGAGRFFRKIPIDMYYMVMAMTAIRLIGSGNSLRKALGIEGIS